MDLLIIGIPIIIIHRVLVFLGLAEDDSKKWEEYSKAYKKVLEPII